MAYELPPPPLAPRTWLSWLGVGVLSLLCLTPTSVRTAIARVLAMMTRRSGSRHLRTAAVNIAACFPDDSDKQHRRRLQNYFTAFWQTVLIQPRLWWVNHASVLRTTHFEGREHIDAVRSAGHPVVLLITHTVALDHGIVALTTQYPMRGIYKPFENPVVDWLTHRARIRFGGEPAARGNQFRAMIRSFEEGRLLGYLSDEDFGAKGSVFAPFFGRQKATLAMLPRLISKTPNVQVLPVASYYNSDTDRIKVRIWPAIANYPGVDELDSAARMNAAIEATIRACPAQFLWKLRIFRTHPEGGASRYTRVEQGEMAARDL